MVQLVHVTSTRPANSGKIDSKSRSQFAPNSIRNLNDATASIGFDTQNLVGWSLNLNCNLVNSRNEINAMTLMKAFSCAAICAIVLAAACESIQISDSYIEMPFGKYQTSSSGDYDVGYFFEWLKKLNLGQSSSSESVLEKLIELRPDAGYMMQAELIDPLVSLASDESDCSEDPMLVRTFLKTYQTAMRTKELQHKETLLAYLDQYGRRKFHICASEAVRELEKSTRSNSDMIEIDDTFNRAVLGADKSSDEELYSKLKDIDGTKVNWKLEKLAFSPVDTNSGNKFLTPVERFSGLFSARCQKFMDNFKTQLDILNLDRALNNGPSLLDSQMSLKKLNEINRVCIQARGHRKEFEDNLKRQLGFKV